MINLKKCTYFIIALLSIFTMKIINYNGLLVKELNITFINSLINSSFYNNEELVSSKSIPVKKITVYDNKLYIENIGDLYFPLSGLITEKGHDYIKIEVDNNVYYLKGIKSYYNLYQYYLLNTPIGNGENIIIEGDSLDKIINKYEENIQEL